MFDGTVGTSDADFITSGQVPGRIAQEPDARRGSGGDEVSRLQGEDLADVAHEERNPERHVPGVAVLAERAIDPAGDFEVPPVELPGGRRGTHGAERVEALGPGPLPVRLLEVPGGHVVERCVPGDDVHGVRFRHPPAPPADHDRDLPLVLDAGGFRWQHDALAITDQRRRRLEEQERPLGHVVAELPGVGDVVAADADDLGRARQVEPSGHADSSSASSTPAAP